MAWMVPICGGAGEDEEDVSGLMQQPVTDQPVFDMLLGTFVTALEEYAEEDRKTIASAMLAHLRRAYTRPVCDQHERLEAALVVYGKRGWRE